MAYRICVLILHIKMEDCFFLMLSFKDKMSEFDKIMVMKTYNQHWTFL